LLPEPQKWAKLIPRIEVWLNSTVASITFYAPIELMFGAKRLNLFENILPELPEGEAKRE
jgi:hypothetical protein